MGLAPGFLRSGLILNRAPNVQRRQRTLKNNQRICAVAETPDNPKDVANKEQPEAPVPLELSLRCDHPRRDDGDGHRRPLNPIDIVHLPSRMKLKNRGPLC